MEEQYKSYSVLDDNWIRVIRLFPGKPSDGIRVELEEVSLASDVTYHALSYHWGDATVNLQRIQCDGKDFIVTANLFAALRRLRSETDVRTMWVDAICINQECDREKTQQICIMVEIYSGAEEVLVWLGEHEEDPALEYTIQVANARWDYGASKKLIQAPFGQDDVIALFHPNPYYHQVVAAARRRIGFSCPPGISSQLEDMAQKFERSLPHLKFLGLKTAAPVEDNARAGRDLVIQTLFPDFNRTHVQAIANTNFESLEEFLLEVTKPAELELSDGESHPWNQQHSFEVVLDKSMDCTGGYRVQEGNSTLWPIPGRRGVTRLCLRNRQAHQHRHQELRPRRLSRLRRDLPQFNYH
jgi:hypothetical protein